jgi:transcriptional regulator GlxA family with amidase domain
LDDSLIQRALRIVMAASSTLEQESALLDLLSDLILRYADQRPVVYNVGPQNVPVQRAIDFIQAHYADKITLDDLALIAALSPYHFQRVFQKHTGLSPHEYLTQVRIKHSQHHLLHGMPLVDVALAVGFGDQSHFTRCFERVMGLSPGKFVRQNSHTH